MDHLPHDHGSHSHTLHLDAPDQETFCIVSDILKLMSDSTRIHIFWLLCHCEECVTNLSALTGMSSPNVSHHIKSLKSKGLITSRREGKEVYYTAAQTQTAQVLHEMIEKVMDLSCPAGSEALPSYDSQVGIIAKVQELITSNLTERYTIEDLSGRFHMNPTTLKATFKAVYGQPIGVYMKHFRIARAKELLQGTDPVSQIAQAVGYENQSKFTLAFKDVTGVLPREYRKAHKG